MLGGMLWISRLPASPMSAPMTKVAFLPMIRLMGFMRVDMIRLKTNITRGIMATKVDFSWRVTWRKGRRRIFLLCNLCKMAACKLSYLEIKWNVSLCEIHKEPSRHVDTGHQVELGLAKPIFGRHLSCNWRSQVFGCIHSVFDGLKGFNPDQRVKHERAKRTWNNQQNNFSVSKSADTSRGKTKSSEYHSDLPIVTQKIIMFLKLSASLGPIIESWLPMPRKIQVTRYTEMLAPTVIPYRIAVNPVLSFWSGVRSGIMARWEIWVAAHPN